MTRIYFLFWGHLVYTPMEPSPSYYVILLLDTTNLNHNIRHLSTASKISGVHCTTFPRSSLCIWSTLPFITWSCRVHNQHVKVSLTQTFGCFLNYITFCVCDYMYLYIYYTHISFETREKGRVSWREVLRYVRGPLRATFDSLKECNGDKKLHWRNSSSTCNTSKTKNHKVVTI